MLNQKEKKLIKEVDRMFDYYEQQHFLPKSILLTEAHYKALLSLENQDHPNAPYEYITHYQGVRIDIEQKKKNLNRYK